MHLKIVPLNITLWNVPTLGSCKLGNITSALSRLLKFRSGEASGIASGFTLTYSPRLAVIIAVTPMCLCFALGVNRITGNIPMSTPDLGIGEIRTGSPGHGPRLRN